MPTRAPTARGVRGFTLIEVLAALIIVSLGMLGVIEAVSQTARNSTYLRDKTLAHWVAMNRLTQARLEPQPPKIDKSSDEVEMADRRWRWTMEVTQSPLPSVRRIDISVRAAEAKDGTSIASVSGFYGTAIAPPGTVPLMWQGTPELPPNQDPNQNPAQSPNATPPKTPTTPVPPPEPPPEPNEFPSSPPQ
ncbi:MAG TPA: type II secretion system minor pseudopilin GspI [Steroidobacteraceae bacterium]